MKSRAPTVFLAAFPMALFVGAMPVTGSRANEPEKLAAIAAAAEAAEAAARKAAEKSGTDLKQLGTKLREIEERTAKEEVKRSEAVQAAAVNRLLEESRMTLGLIRNRFAEIEKQLEGITIDAEGGFTKAMLQASTARALLRMEADRLSQMKNTLETMQAAKRSVSIDLGGGAAWVMPTNVELRTAIEVKADAISRDGSTVTAEGVRSIGVPAAPANPAAIPQIPSGQDVSGKLDRILERLERLERQMATPEAGGEATTAPPPGR